MSSVPDSLSLLHNSAMARIAAVVEPEDVALRELAAALLVAYWRGHPGEIPLYDPIGASTDAARRILAKRRSRGSHD